MKDFKGNPLILGDKVIFTDSFSRLMEGTVVGFFGKMIHISPLKNQSGHSKTVHSSAVMKYPNDNPD